MNDDPKSTFHVRKYRDADRAQVRSICFRTGLFGDPVASVYGDPESFADMFTSYYTDREPENAWVVARNDDDRVIVGYLLGCVDSRKAWDPVSIAVKHVLCRGLLFRPSTAPYFFRLIRDVIVDRGVHRTAIDFDKYPAHNHIDLLPEARGAFGEVLADLYHADLIARGVRGAHGETIAENKRLLRFAESYGYQTFGRPYPLPGMRDQNGARLHGIAVVRDLTVPFAPRKSGARTQPTSNVAVSP